jgi:hypothetical protein
MRCLKMPRRSPNSNPFAGSWVRAVKAEALNKMIPFGEKHVRFVVEQCAEHHNLDPRPCGLALTRSQGLPFLPDIACRRLLAVSVLRVWQAYLG